MPTDAIASRCLDMMGNQEQYTITDVSSLGEQV